MADVWQTQGNDPKKRFQCEVQFLSECYAPTCVLNQSNKWSTNRFAINALEDKLICYCDFVLSTHPRVKWILPITTEVVNPTSSAFKSQDAYLERSLFMFVLLVSTGSPHFPLGIHSFT